MNSPRFRVLLVSIVPPRNDCGVRIVMYRHLVERAPFDLHVVSNADFAPDLLIHSRINLPYPVEKVRKSRFGPLFQKWITDYENFVWPLHGCRTIDEAVVQFRPDVILTLAETSLCHLARQVARRHRVPLAGLFLDWFPIMGGHYGSKWTQGILSRRYRQLYVSCDLAFCTSDGMQEVLGPHPNSHVVYPMPGMHPKPDKIQPPKTGKFRLVYVGSVENFYGRMICSLIEQIEPSSDLEIIVVGPNADWPEAILTRAKAKGTYLGFKPPDQAAEVLASADALLVVMSFEKEQELFMRTSFTTKFLDYVAFGKPVILWGPDYCTPSRLAAREDAAVVVNNPDSKAIVAACRKLMSNPSDQDKYSVASERLYKTHFNPDRLQGIFVREIQNLINV